MWRFSVLLLGMVVMSSAVFACTVVDSIGRRVYLSQPAKRIISLSPEITEMLFAAGAGKAIVGVDKSSDFPAAAKALPVVANYPQLDEEAIIRLHPDLIVAGQMVPALINFNKRHMPIYVYAPIHMLDIPNALRQLGCLSGTVQVANNAANQFLRHYAALKKRFSHSKSVTVFYEIWHKPMLTVANASWLNEIFTACGGNSIFAFLPGSVAEVDSEAVFYANPEVIFSASSEWASWPELVAVKKHHVYTLVPDELERASNRALDGMQAVCQRLEQARLV